MLKIAHRGASKLAPENTIEAFKKAIELNADVIEFDVHQTRDGKIIVIHDHDLKRTIGCPNSVRSLSLKEIRENCTANGSSIPTLEETIRVLRGRCICKIDIRDPMVTESSVVFILKKYKIEDTAIITSEIFGVLKKIRNLLPQTKVEAGGFGFKSKVSAGEIIREAQEVQADIIGLHYSIVTKKLIEKIHKAGLEIHVWTVNNRKTIQRMKKMGIDGITTDYLDRVD